MALVKKNRQNGNAGKGAAKAEPPLAGKRPMRERQ